MTGAAILISHLQDSNIGFDFTRFIQPMAVGFIAFAAFKISTKVVKSKTGIVLMVLAAIVSWYVTTHFYMITPYVLPFLLLGSGAVTAVKFKTQPIEEKEKMNIQWSNFFLWLAVFILAAVLGGITQALPIKLFENFYRNGSLIFGGGQVLIPLMYTEFVEFKDYLSSSEFLSGIAIVQSVPGPVFSISGYIGALSMREYSIWGELLGGG